MNEKPDITGHILIFKTGKLHEIDMAAERLAEKRIPFYKQEKSVSGLTTAFPFQPSMEPGTWFSIFVPEIAFDDAKLVLSELPFDLTVDPDIWYFDSRAKTKRRWRAISWIIIGVTIVVLLFLIIVAFISKV